MPKGNKGNTKYIQMYCDRCKKVTKHWAVIVKEVVVEAICEKCKPCI